MMAREEFSRRRAAWPRPTSRSARSRSTCQTGAWPTFGGAARPRAGLARARRG